jgi:protease-4
MTQVLSGLRCATVVGLFGLASAAGTALSQTQVALLEISGSPGDRADPMGMLFGGSAPTLMDYVDVLHDAADDDEVDGLVIRLKDAAIGFTQVEELSAGIEAVRDAGKRVVVFAEGYGPTDLLLGASADHVILQQGGTVSAPGMYMEEMFLKDTLAWAGLKADMIQVGDYKGANEQMMRSEPSEAWDENISGLLDAMYGQLRSGLMEGRGLTDAELDQAMREAWMAPGSVAKRVGLIDMEADYADLWTGDALADAFGDDIEYAGELLGSGESQLDTSNPFALFSMLMEGPDVGTDGPTIAVLHLAGPIMDGESSSGGAFGGESVGSRTLRNAMSDIARDDNVLGCVVRIDSPGGSASASEMIWQGLQDLADEKPVWISIGSMAASGGYYSAVGGEKIYVNPSSIVGSIGVVGGKITGGELLDRVKVGVTERARGPRASMMSFSTEWNNDERALVRARMIQTYAQFANRVRAGRPGIDLDQVGEGRLFIGQDAVDLGMADAVGGLDDAIMDMAESLDLAEFDVVDFPAPPSFDELLEQAFGGFVRARDVSSDATLPLAGALEAALGTKRFEAVRDAANGIMLLQQEPVLLTMPRVVLIR